MSHDSDQALVDFLRAESTLYIGEFDNFFKELITAGWNVSSDGDVESPFGHFATVEVPLDNGELNEMGDAMEWSSDQPIPPRGWYFCRENSDGIIFVYHSTEVAVKAIFEAYSKEYAKWGDE